MTNEDLNQFLKEQRDLKYHYLGGTRDNQSKSATNPTENNRNETDSSPGAEGRNI